MPKNDNKTENVLNLLRGTFLGHPLLFVLFALFAFSTVMFSWTPADIYLIYTFHTVSKQSCSQFVKIDMSRGTHDTVCTNSHLEIDASVIIRGTQLKQ